MLKIRTNKLIEVLAENSDNIVLKGEKLKVIKDGYEIELKITNYNYTDQYDGRVFYITNIMFDYERNYPVVIIETDKRDCYIIPAEMPFYVYNTYIKIKRIVEETKSESEEDNDSYDCCDNDYDEDDQYEDDDYDYDNEDDNDNYDEDDDECD